MRIKLSVLVLVLLFNVTVLFGQTGDQIAATLADPTFLPGTWKSVPMNANYKTQLTTNYSGNVHLGNMMGYATLAAWDWNRDIVHFSGNDHQDYNHYFTFTEATNAAATHCFNWSGHAIETSDGTTIHDLGAFNIVTQMVGSSLIIASTANGFNAGTYTITGYVDTSHYTVSPSATGGGAGTPTGVTMKYPGCYVGTMSHGYQHIAVDSITGTVFQKGYIGQLVPGGNNIIDLWKLPGGDMGTASWVEIAPPPNSLGPPVDNEMACGWRDGAYWQESALTAGVIANSIESDSQGSWWCVDPIFQEYLVYSLQRDSWYYAQGSTMPNSYGNGIYQNVGDYNPESASTVYGGGNASDSGYPWDFFHIWRLDQNGTVTQLTDSPVALGLQHGATIVTEPGTTKFLIIAPDCVPACPGNGYVPDVAWGGSFFFYELDPFAANSTSGRPGVYTTLTPPTGMAPPLGYSSLGIAPWGDNLGGTAFFAMRDKGAVGAMSCYTDVICSFMLYKPPTYAGLSFSDLCAQPGVVLCQGWDNAGDFTHYDSPGGGNTSPYGQVPQNNYGTYGYITQDTSQSVSGGSSMEITTPAVTAGNVLYPDVQQWYTNIATGQALYGVPATPAYTFKVDKQDNGVAISTIARSSNVVTVTTASGTYVTGQFVQISGVTDTTFDGIFRLASGGSSTFTFNQTLANGSSSGGIVGNPSRIFVQLRQRADTNFMQDNWEEGLGQKMGAGIGAGDASAAGGAFQASCTGNDTILVDDNYRGYLYPEHSCTGSTSHGPYIPFDENLYGDIALEQARGTPYCLHNQLVGGNPPPNTNPFTYNNFFPPTGNCFEFIPNDWATIEYEYILGKAGTSYGPVSQVVWSGVAAGTVSSTLAPDSCVAAFVGQVGSGLTLTVTNTGTTYNVTIATAGTGYNATVDSGGSPLYNDVCTIKGHHLGSGVDGTNDLTVTILHIYSQNSGTVGKQPNDEASNSWVNVWAAHDGQPLLPVYSYGPLQYTMTDGGGGPLNYVTAGKLWLLDYVTNRCYNSGTYVCTANYPAAHTWRDNLIISTNWIPNPAASGSPPPPSPGTTNRIHMRPAEELNY